MWCTSVNTAVVLLMMRKTSVGDNLMFVMNISVSAYVDRTKELCEAVE
jgi:hypothetical protein